jgi:hypothetical protein
LSPFIHGVITVVVGGMMFYAMFSEEFEHEVEEPKLKAPKKPDIRKMKKNGQWVDVKVYDDK